jgi:hypothetical protein
MPWSVNSFRWEDQVVPRSIPQPPDLLIVFFAEFAGTIQGGELGLPYGFGVLLSLLTGGRGDLGFDLFAEE